MSQTSAVKVDDKYQTVLPETICKQLNVREGDELLVDVQDGLLIMLPRPSSFVDRLRGLHREIWAGIDTDTYLREEREAWDRSASN